MRLLNQAYRCANQDLVEIRRLTLVRFVEEV